MRHFGGQCQRVLFREVGIFGDAAFTWNILTTSDQHVCGARARGQYESSDSWQHLKISISNKLLWNFKAYNMHSFCMKFQYYFWILENAPLGSRLYKNPKIQFIWCVRWTHVNYYPELFWGQNKFGSPVGGFFY